MMTSDASWSTKARRISELELPDHFFLDDQDECYYFGDYTPRKGFNHSKANQFISNLKKDLKHRGQYAWRYKEQAIQQGGRMLSASLNKAAADRIILVPIPPSKPPNHCEYDDRIQRLCAFAQPFRTAELLTTAAPREPAHHQDGGRSIDAVYNSLSLHVDRLPDASICILIDDVLTTGSSFKACKRKILEMGGIETVVGFFMARCAWPKVEFPPLEF